MKCFIFHKYGRWSKPYKSTYQKSVGSFGDSTSAPITLQERICKKCGKVETRKVAPGHKENTK